jgi:predicted Fe-Mo cluster-binding NifX family protein
MSRKIAVISDDGKTISQHFGRAPYYVVVTVENNKIINKEQRAKAGHHSFGAQAEEHPAPGVPHGFDAGSQAKHAVMAQPIGDCKVLLAGGMGRGAYESLMSAGIESIITDVLDMDRAVVLYSEGKLPNLLGSLH